MAANSSTAGLTWVPPAPQGEGGGMSEGYWLDANGQVVAGATESQTLSENMAATGAIPSDNGQALAPLFGLPLYNGTNALGQAYSNQLKPGADYMNKRTAQAAENERVTNLLKPKPYMPSWATQQPAANWLGARPDPKSYFPGIPTVTGGSPGSGTNLGFGTVFGSLAPSTQTAGGDAPVANKYDNVQNGGGYTYPTQEQIDAAYQNIHGGNGTGNYGAGRQTYLSPEQLQAYRDAATRTPESYYPGLNGIPAGTKLDWAGNADAYSMTRDLAPEFGPLPPDARNQQVTAKWATGQQTYDPSTFAKSITAVPEAWKNYYLPPQYFGKALPAGAYVTLFPNSAGTGWSKVKPEGWGPNWRPTGTG